MSETDLHNIVRAKLEEFLHSKGYGVNPVALTQTALRTLGREGYWCAPKDNGERAMLLFTKTEDGIIQALIDRERNVTLVHIRCANALHAGTLLDGEVMTKDDGKKVFRVFDGYKTAGTDLFNYRLTDRHKLIKGACSSIDNKHPLADLVVVHKEFFPVTELGAWKASHVDNRHVDGLIFMPNLAGPKIGVDFDTFKWKPHILTSVDFMIELSESKAENPNVALDNFDYGDEEDAVMTPVDSPSESEAITPMVVVLKIMLKNGDKTQFTSLSLEEFCSKDGVSKEDQAVLAGFGFSIMSASDILKAGNDAIIECIPVKQTGKWKPILHRTNKSTPNLIDVVQQTINSIQNPITFDAIVTAVQHSLFSPGALQQTLS